MEKKWFFKKVKIIRHYLRYNYGWIIFFTIFWIVINLFFILISILCRSDYMKGNYISDYSITFVSGPHKGLSSNTNFPISYCVNVFTFSAPGVAFFSVVILFFINKIFLNEVKTKEISSWLVLPISRNNSFSSKILFTLITNIIIFIPTYILIVGFASSTVDANKYIGNVILCGLMFAIFISFLNFICWLIAVALMEKGAIVNIIIALLTVYIIVIHICYQIFLPKYPNSSITKVFKYLNPLFLMGETLIFDEGSEYIYKWTINQSNGDVMKLFGPNLKKINIPLITLSSLIMLFLPVGLTYISTKIFKNKSLHV